MAESKLNPILIIVEIAIDFYGSTVGIHKITIEKQLNKL